MANTTNLNLTKLTGTEKQKTFPSPYNDNMDAIDGAFGADFGVSGKPSVNSEINSLGDGLAILANGNTHAAITSGQFVYVRGHGTLADGLYQATSNIAQDGTLSGSNLTADSSGGLNTVYSSLNSNLANKIQDFDVDVAGTSLSSTDGGFHYAMIDLTSLKPKNSIIMCYKLYDIWYADILYEISQNNLVIKSINRTAVPSPSGRKVGIRIYCYIP